MPAGHGVSTSSETPAMTRRVLVIDLGVQEQLAQIKHFWSKYGNLITWLLIAVLGAFAAWNGWNYWQTRNALQAAVLYDELERGAQAIATDAGSTDSGAAYLALGKSKNNRGAVKRDLTILMRAQAATGVPIIVGTSGQAGGDLNLAWTRDIVLEVARELNIAPKIALIHCEQEKARLKQLNAQGRISPLAPSQPLDDATIERYLRLKLEHPRAVVFLTAGAFCQSFFEDAVACGRVLRIAVRDLSAESEAARIPVCGIPRARLETYLGLLRQAGREVHVE